MKRFTKLLSVVFVLVLSLTVLAACGSGGSSSSSSGGSGGTAESPSPADGGSKETIKLRIGSGYTPEGAAWTRVVKDYFVPEVDKRLSDTNYEINWTEAYSGTVAKPGEELGAVENNLLDMAFVVSPIEPSALKISNIGYNVPFSSSDAAIFNTAVKAIFDKHPEFAGEYEAANQKVLALGVTEPYELMTKAPFNTIEELKGVRIQTTPANVSWVEPVGISPVQSNLSEAYQNLQSGVHDGVVIYSGSGYGYKLHEQAKYFTEVGFGCAIIGALTVNQDTWSSLPDEVRAVIEEVAAGYSDALVTEVKRERAENVALMEEEGATVVTLSDEERKKWTQQVSHVPNDYAQWLNSEGLPGSEIVADFIQAQIDAGHQFPTDYTID